jgi:hypothetical protein
MTKFSRTHSASPSIQWSSVRFFTLVSDNPSRDLATRLRHAHEYGLILDPMHKLLSKVEYQSP